MQRLPPVGELFASGRIIDGILAFMMLEVLVLLLVRARLPPQFASSDLFVDLAAGAALMLALRAALTGAPWQSVALWLSVSLGLHGSLLTLRWSMRRTK